ncbi:hypothetical protein HUT18_29030 [Streptomyces sp. NA04227]|uniref:hypothetical protein n=1 Tax=Streptomyces sp. NA04227 TaxID=2742136 RepID=UPI0015900974|nr:hypothetical protein [Streptomyces sp. NA04227]QKW09852.1 hypothetical protein HUT18_29030 [Streptomyces sp. NA04227]
MAERDGTTGVSTYEARLQDQANRLKQLKVQRGDPSLRVIEVRARTLFGENTSLPISTQSAAFGAKYVSLDKLMLLVRTLLSWDEYGEKCAPPDRRATELAEWREQWVALAALRPPRRRNGGAVTANEPEAKGSSAPVTETSATPQASPLGHDGPPRQKQEQQEEQEQQPTQRTDLGRNTDASPGRMTSNRLVVAVDLAGAADHHDGWLAALHQRLAEALDASTSALQVEPHRIHRLDTGDGYLLLFPPSVPTPYVMSMWVRLLHEELQRAKADGQGLRLRVGARKGAVGLSREGVSGPEGVLGRTVTDAVQLADADSARSSHFERADLVLGISEDLYEESVRPYSLAVPEQFIRYVVRSKDRTASGWFRAIS